MPLYDSYEKYRPMLTPEQQELIQQATVRSKELALRQVGERVPGGYQGQKGFVEDPLVAAHMKLAMEMAAEQFKKLPVMPEDCSISFRFAELDPIGKYSLIDMKFAHRYNQILAAAQIRGQDVQHTLSVLQQKMKENPRFRPFMAKIRQIVENHRLLSRASKLCWSPEGRELLHQKARTLEHAPEVEKYDTLLQGMEYLVGILPASQGLPEAVEALYKALELPVPTCPDGSGAQPECLCIKFQNFNNQMLQYWYASPTNWGKAYTIEPYYRPHEAYAAIQRYTESTVSSVLNTVFAPARSVELQPVDLIRINGVCLRNLLDPEGDHDLTPAQIDTQAVSAVAAALMAGQKVEVLLPNALGELYQEPIPVTMEEEITERKNRIIQNARARYIARQCAYFSMLRTTKQERRPVGHQ